MGEDQGRYKMVTVWLDDRGHETLNALKAKYGSTKSGALRVGLELIRKQLNLDPPLNGEQL